MPSRVGPLQEAKRLLRWQLIETGRELRIARIAAGMTQRQVGRLVGCAASTVSRIEHGLVPSLSLSRIMQIAAAVGLKAWVRTFPLGRRPLDGPQLSLLEAFNSRLHESFDHELEVLMPIPGDLRAADEVIRNKQVSCAIEAITRFAEVQGQLRAGKAKQRDLGCDRLILLVRGSHANRRMITDAGQLLREALPIDTRQALGALAAGMDPGGDCLVVL
jgi:transcriptional regulator with XRE-family HTH domain